MQTRKALYQLGHMSPLICFFHKGLVPFVAAGCFKTCPAPSLLPRCQSQSKGSHSLGPPVGHVLMSDSWMD